MFAVLLLGGNVGDLRATFSVARERICSVCGSLVWRGEESSSRAWGYDSDRFYLNQVVIISSELGGLALLDCLESIELSLGRVDKGGLHWADEDRCYSDRTIDIDILYMFDESGSLAYSDERLVVPHPRISQREFVLDLLREVDFPLFVRVFSKQ
ncbi:MAG: 2-amino-4-hydroxy-6-hydroxymethyldihydropteridine diphosphokinase [Rikenellaceae bacterium]